MIMSSATEGSSLKPLGSGVHAQEKRALAAGAEESGRMEELKVKATLMESNEAKGNMRRSSVKLRVEFYQGLSKQPE